MLLLALRQPGMSGWRVFVTPWSGDVERPNPQAKEAAMPDDYVSCEDLLDAFALEDEAGEPEPEYGDFWGELDDDCDAGN